MPMTSAMTSARLTPLVPLVPPVPVVAVLVGVAFAVGEGRGLAVAVGAAVTRSGCSVTLSTALLLAAPTK